MNTSNQNSTSKIDERLDVALCGDPMQIHLHEQRYVKALGQVLPGDDLLEIVTGLGVFSERVAPAVASYRGIEYNEEACRAERERVAEPEKSISETIQHSNSSWLRATHCVLNSKHSYGPNGSPAIWLA
jgi:ubiquinone/menaquinone biosynthesis C-methylase UbiE